MFSTCPKVGRVCGDDHVAGERQFKAAAQRGAMNGGECRDRCVLQHVEELEELIGLCWITVLPSENELISAPAEK